MKHIVVDLEMNCLSREYQQERQTCSMEIIEIGAVVLDEKYQEIGCFKTYVKPQYNAVIEKYYERLTGISTGMVENAPVLEEALSMFISWCRSMRDDLQIYQWSGTDIDQIKKEILLKGIVIHPDDEEMFCDWKDLQKEYGETLGVERNISLQNALMYADLDFQGDMHDALFDARNTAFLLDIIRDVSKCKKALGKVIDALHPSMECNTTLGSLFDFGSFVLG